MVMRVGLVGCGLIGRKRAQSLGEHQLVVVADIDRDRARNLARGIPGCRVADRWEKVADDDQVDLVIVATSNDSLVPVGRRAVAAGKHVLIEKPAARNADELAPLVEEARNARVVAKVGFNHRFHPAILQARAIFDSGAVGPLMYIRARYGHGGRLGYEREWRADPQMSGGGELLDQGVHLIDLARWFAGEFVEATGHVGTFFWNMPVEDNGFMLLKTAKGQVAWLHASWSEWKNLFSFEIFGRDGLLQINGLGGSYGVERLVWYRMLPQMGPPETTTWEYPGEDTSWRAEFQDLTRAIERDEVPSGTVEDALAALRVIDAIYRSSGRAPALTEKLR